MPEKNTYATITLPDPVQFYPDWLRFVFRTSFSHSKQKEKDIEMEIDGGSVIEKELMRTFNSNLKPICMWFIRQEVVVIQNWI